MGYVGHLAHFFHTNILKYCNRPFADSSIMNYELIKRWNEKIGPDDVVYHLGDFALGCKEHQLNGIISQLNFGHMHVCSGNHEKCFSEWYYKNKPNNVSFYGSYLETKLLGRDFTLCHYAMKIWNRKHHKSLHLYGHSHNTLVEDNEARSMDVGVDTNNFYPYALSDILKYLDKKIDVPIDHHGK